jgi:2-methylcitrate dehydratase PrpD
MRDPTILALLDKVEIDPDPPPLPDRFPHRHGGTVTIVMKDGRRHTHTCKSPRGSGARGIDWADVDAKFRHLVPLSGLPSARVEASLDCIHGFGAAGDAQRLARLLRA